MPCTWCRKTHNSPPSYKASGVLRTHRASRRGCGQASWEGGRK
nr:MAG TPA: hypothetical protein [Caudoviricetes sp.]